MGTEVLRPHDCLVERFPVFQGSYGLGYTKTKNHFKTDHKKRYNNHQQQTSSTRFHSRAISTHSNYGNDFEIGRVSSCRFKKERRNKFDQADMYAGSACSVSPCPSALPLPTFFKKQEDLNAFHDSATKDLRRLLRLN